MDLNQEITFADTVFAQEVDGEMVLLDMNSESYFGLDEIGTAIWRGMQEKKTLQEVFELLLNQYDVGADLLKQDLLAFVDKLVKHGIVSTKKSEI